MGSNLINKDELLAGVWLSEQSPERQRVLWGEHFFERNCAWFVVFIAGENRKVYQDVCFGGNEAELDGYANEKSRSLGTRIARIETYRLSARWCSSHSAPGKTRGPLKREIPHNVVFISLLLFTPIHHCIVSFCAFYCKSLRIPFP